MKKIFNKLYKFILILILFIKNFFVNITDNDSSEGTEFKRDYILNLVDFKNIYKEVNNLVKDVNKANNIVKSKDQKQAYEIIKEKYGKIEEVLKDIELKSTFDEVKLEDAIKKLEYTKDVLDKHEISNKKYEKTVEEAKDEMTVKEITKEDIINLTSEKTRDLYAMYVYEANTSFKAYEKELKYIEDEIKKNQRLDENKYKLETLKEKIKIIKDNYYEFKHNRFIYELENDFNLKEIDKYGILTDSKSIEEMLKKCNALIIKIDETKKIDEVKKEKPKEEKKVEKETKKEKKEEKPKDKNDLSANILEAASIIESDIERQSKLIEKFEQTILTSPTFEIRGRRLGFFDNLINNAIRFSLNFLQVRKFKSKKLNSLVSGYMLNNSIRTMRKVVSNNSICNYIALSRNIRTELDISASYERIMNDSLYQVSILRDEFLSHYGYLETAEIKKIYAKLDTLEENITKELDRIKDAKSYLNKVKKMTKKRV